MGERAGAHSETAHIGEGGETTEIGLPNPGFGLMRVANTPLLATRIRERDFCRSQAIFGKYGFLAPIPPYAGCQIPGWQPADTATGNLLSARIGGNYFREPRFSRSCSLTRLQPRVGCTPCTMSDVPPGVRRLLQSFNRLYIQQPYWYTLFFLS